MGGCGLFVLTRECGLLIKFVNIHLDIYTHVHVCVIILYHLFMPINNTNIHDAYAQMPKIYFYVHV